MFSLNRPASVRAFGALAVQYTLCWLIAFVACGCSRNGSEAPSRLVVFAASSLTNAFEECEVLFEAEHPGVDVLLSTAGSQALRTQIEHGAAADVFASANLTHVAMLREAGLVGESQPLAQNRLVIAVPLDNPAGIRSFQDLPKASRIVIGNPQVPLGEYTRESLEMAGQSGFAQSVLAQVVSEEPNARLVLAKVALGEADAAVVYRTDALGRDDVEVIEIPDSASPPINYAIAVVDVGATSEHAATWVEFVTQNGCVDALRARHFGRASP